MTAKEMFEKLGWECAYFKGIRGDGMFDGYIYTPTEYHGFEENITFNKVDHSLRIIVANASAQLLKAINEQYEELGW